MQPLTLKATVTSASSIPSGQVTFTTGITVLGSAPLDRTGTATLVVPALGAGNQQITATFATTQDFLGSQNSLSQQVNTVASSTAIAVTPASSYLGSNVAITIAVSSGVASPSPSGLVTCTDGGVSLGTVTLINGNGSTLTSALPAGSSAVVCTYAGDAVFAASTSANAAVNVKVRYPSTVALAVTAAGAPVATVGAGTNVLLSAHVSSDAGPVSQGQVVFCDSTSSGCTDIHQVGLVQLDSTGTATLSVTPGPGTHSYTARFLGLPSAQPTQSSTATLTVTGWILSTATLAATGGPGSYTLTAQLTGAGPTPTGTVKFLDTSAANALLGSASLTAATGTSLFSSTTIATPSRISAVSSADLNGDGHPDLAIATGSNGGILILLGNGDGTFTAGQTLHSITTGGSNANTSLLVFGDFNGDGHLDLGALNNYDKSLAIFFGLGDGTFNLTPVQNTATSAYDIFSLTVADINGDGKADLIGAAQGDNAAVFLVGNGDGTFQNVTPQSVSPSPRKVVVGDFNEDGYTDVVLTSGGQGSLSVLLGVGDGTFRSVAAPAFGGTPISAAAADLNGDGHLDLAITDDTSASVRILLGKGDGTFQTLSASYPTGTTPIEITAGDFNGDGRVDLAVANELGNSVTLLLGKGDGTFTISTVPTGLQPEFLTAADLNGDGRTDLLVGNVGESDATLLLAQGSNFATATLANVAPLGVGTHLVQASYSGDSNSTPHLTNIVTLVAQTANTTLSLVATPAQSSFGQTLTFMATLTPDTAGSSSSDGEDITFLNGTAVLGTCALKGGTCTSNAPALNAGNYTVSARYGGDPALAASVSASVPVTIQAAPDSITLSVANHTFGDAPFSVIATSLTGGPFSFSVVSGPASVSGSTVTLTGAGTVVLRVDQGPSGNYAASSKTATFTVAPASQTIDLTVPSTAVYGSSPLTVTAQASSGLPVALSVLSGPAMLNGNVLSFNGAGAVVIAADQAGNADYSPGTQVRQTIQVSPAPVSLTWSPQGTLVYGAALQNVLNATATAGSSTVSGSFAYTLAGAPLSTTTVLNAGAYTVQVIFTPTDTTRYASASATANLTIAKAAAGIVLTTSGSAVFSGNPVLMTATVSSAAGTPTGSVIFMNGSAVLGTANLNSGIAQLSVASLPMGTQTLTATFSGGDNFLGGTSAPVAETVQDFILTTPSQSPVVTATGSVATTTFTLNASGQTFPQALTFSASGLPAGATATFSPASLPAGSTATSVTVTFKLPNTTARLLPHNASSGVALAMLLLVLPASGLRARNKLRSLVRNRQSVLLGAALGLFLLGVTGCGGNSSGSSQPSPAPAKSYVVTLTATSGALQRSTTITLQVQ